MSCRQSAKQNAGDVVLASTLFRKSDQVGTGGFKGRGGENCAYFALAQVECETVCSQQNGGAGAEID
jgi:hypothetical protein